VSPFLDLTRALPTTPEHWQAVAAAAAGQLMIDDLRQRGWLTGGPEIDREACEELLTFAAANDVLVGVDQAVDAGLQLWAGWNDEATRV
jgi:hypothetical protein